MYIHRSCKFCVECDRWGGTPLDDALYRNEPECVSILREAGMVAGGIQRRGICGSLASESKLQLDDSKVNEDAPHVVWPAYSNDLDRLIQLCASGKDLNVADYDHRTPLHLAASEGNKDCIVYLVAKATDRGAALRAVDRWGNTPHDDAVRHGYRAAAALLQRLETEINYVPRLADIRDNTIPSQN